MKMLSLLDATVMLCPLDEPSERLLPQVALTDAQRLRLAGLGAERRRREYLAACLLVQQRYGSAAHLSHTPSGAPQLVGTTDGVSVSHSGSLLAVAFAPSAVGVDLESVRRFSPALLRRILSADEAAALPLASSLEAARGMTFWTSKEAAFKRFSSEGITHITEVHLTLSPSHAPLCASYGSSSSALAHAFFDDWVLTVAR